MGILLCFLLLLSRSLSLPSSRSCITNVKCCSIQSIDAANGQVIEASRMIRNPNYVFTNRFLCGPSAECENKKKHILELWDARTCYHVCGCACGCVCVSVFRFLSHSLALAPKFQCYFLSRFNLNWVTRMIAINYKSVIPPYIHTPYETSVLKCEWEPLHSCRPILK